jgi:hypothetical protein
MGREWNVSELNTVVNEVVCKNYPILLYIVSYVHP